MFGLSYRSGCPLIHMQNARVRCCSDVREGIAYNDRTTVVQHLLEVQLIYLSPKTVGTLNNDCVMTFCSILFLPATFVENTSRFYKYVFS